VIDRYLGTYTSTELMIMSSLFGVSFILLGHGEILGP
jgi:hypothetical protein